jgi:uncharacterized cupredoxin-like copper-binding protein
MKRHFKTLSIILGMLAALTGGSVFAHGDKLHKKKNPAAVSADEKPFGRAGDPAKVDRTITLDMKDEMRFIPATLSVRQGETIKFVVSNTGKIMHELVIGTLKDLQEHAALMRKFPDMEHDEPYMTHVKPGTSGEIVWQFSRAGQFNYACLIAGHFEAGMVGEIAVAAK